MTDTEPCQGRAYVLARCWTREKAADLPREEAVAFGPAFGQLGHSIGEADGLLANVELLEGEGHREA